MGLNITTFRLLNPRKGTETKIHNDRPAYAFTILSAYLIPARGLKLDGVFLVDDADPAFRLLNPRKGTETIIWF